MNEKSNLVPRSERRKKYGTDCKEPSLTKQAFKEQCDINSVLDRAKRGASLSHLANHQQTYGDFSDWDAYTYEEMHNKLARAKSLFNDLPAELRSEFDNNPGKFLEFVNDPENKDRLEEIFPVLAQPGKQFPDVIGGLATQMEILNGTLAAASSDAPAEAASDSGGTPENS